MTEIVEDDNNNLSANTLSNSPSFTNNNVLADVKDYSDHDNLEAESITFSFSNSDSEILIFVPQIFKIKLIVKTQIIFKVN